MSNGYGKRGGEGQCLGRIMGRGRGRGQGGGDLGRSPGMECGQGNCRGSKKGRRVPPLVESSQVQSLAEKAREIREQAEEMLVRLRKAGLAFQAPQMSQHSQTSPDGAQALGEKVAVIDLESCMCCWLCINICPEQAVTMTDRIEVDWSKCTGCGSCVDECPTEAIILSEAAQSVAS